MCGIVGAIAQRDVAPILLEGLKRLEYRGYDSAGIAVLDSAARLQGAARLQRIRTTGKVQALQDALTRNSLAGPIGIAHTRWATHGKPSTANAHPHVCRNTVAVVHNGIIENYEALRGRQIEQGYEFTSQTDTEVIVHQIYHHIISGADLLQAVRQALTEFEGAYAVGVISATEPDRLVATRCGSPLVIGVGIGEHFIASDVFALLPVTQRFIFLEEGDIADVRRDGVTLYNAEGRQVVRPIKTSELRVETTDRGSYRHYMLKEIFEQPRAITETLNSRCSGEGVLEQAFGPRAAHLLTATRAVQIVACGTSYHAGLVARHWMESLAGLECKVEVASEFRYRSHAVREGTLFVAVSQSGETADTLAALREAEHLGFCGTLAICNVPESSLVRESDLVLMTHAGPEIGVASTKAFTTQLVALLLLVMALGRRNGMDRDTERRLASQLLGLPAKVEQALALNTEIAQLAQRFVDKHHALFLGRGAHYPVAMEGALKLKEISYVHAEAYPAGELKHGPLALVDSNMPVVAVAPNDELLEKLNSNLQEVRARGGRLFVFADPSVAMKTSSDTEVLRVPATDPDVAPVVFTIPLQLLAYHVAVLKGTDVDQPRNLAKSVTVE
jgi:glucosamine--fructose-6-phosphate aminotransferase (isomerizing)